MSSTDLKVAVQDTEKSWNRRLSITVPADRIQRTRSSVASQLSRNASLPGFRKGKLPQRVIEQRYGAAIEQETLDRTIQEAYREALEREGIVPITQGAVENIQYEPGTDLVFDVAFEVRPEPTLERVSGFTVARPSSEVGDEEVDSVLERLRDDRAVWHPVEGGAKPDLGDQVLVEITAREADAEEDEEPTPRPYRFVLGEEQAIPAVEEAIMSLEPGQEGDFTVRFPDDFPDEAQAGKTQHMHIRLDEVKRKEVPALDDELARSVGDFDDLAALRARILEDLKADAERRAEAEVRGQLLDQIVEANAFEVPDSMVERYTDFMLRVPQEKQREMSAEEAEQMAKVRESVRPQSEWSIKRMLVVDQIAEREGLSATQDEIDERIEELAEQHDQSPSEIYIQLEKSGQLETLEREIMEDKVFDFLKGQNTVTEQ
jgi:trigger factor